MYRSVIYEAGVHNVIGNIFQNGYYNNMFDVYRLPAGRLKIDTKLQEIQCLNTYIGKWPN